ncbi:hypothetical protein ABIE30_003634 [Janthinobacterium lividum]|uniref:hypothetical protein n=1 Tax=Janthinobacterium lividum TaxID=29581 RepID=UPI003D1B59BD
MNTVQMKTSPTLLEAMKQAIHHKPTEEQIRKQRISFIYGSLDKDSILARDRIENVLDVHEGRTTR